MHLASAADLREQFEARDKVDLSVLNQQALAFARKRAAELVGRKWVDGALVDNPDARWAITDTTRHVLEELVQRAFSAGLTPDEAAQEIEDSGIFGEARAEMVASTEMARAQIKGALTTAKDIGVVAKQSELSGDHDIDDECDEAVDDGVVAIEDSFSTGEDGPPYHPNCNCALVFYTADDPEAAEVVNI